MDDRPSLLAEPGETDALPSVEIAVQRRAEEGRLAVILLNQSTNQHYPDPIRYVVPVHDLAIRLRLQGEQVREVTTVSGADVRWEVSEGELRVSIPRIDAYEALLVALDTKD